VNERRMILGDVWNLPREVSEVKGKDPGTFLQFNTHMVTFYQQTYGELSRFFLALRDGRLIGSRCGTCRQVMVPAATWHCPTCDFAEMKEVDLPHRGVLAATAPITIFPSATRRSPAVMWTSPSTPPSPRSSPRACEPPPACPAPGSS
jgi:hypothetical protein